MRHTNLTNEIHEEPKDHSNLIIGITFGIVIMFCAVVYVVVSFIEAVSY